MKKPRDLADIFAERLKDHTCHVHFADDLYLGGFPSAAAGAPGASFLPTSGRNPTAQQGVGPAGRVFIGLDIVPLTKSTTNIAALQSPAGAGSLALTAGTGITQGVAPDGSGATVYQTDVPRLISLTSANNLSAVNFTLTGYDVFGRKTTSTIAGPDANTVNFPKAVASVLSITCSAAAAAVSGGTADIFGINWRVNDASQVVSVRGNNTLAEDAGTLTSADGTNPATASTGDPRGTYAPSFASNGSRRVVLMQYLDSTQAGPFCTVANAIGVTPA